MIPQFDAINTESIYWENLSNDVTVKGGEGRSRKKEVVWKETSHSGRKGVMEREVRREGQKRGRKVGGAKEEETRTD